MQSMIAQQSLIAKSTAQHGRRPLQSQTLPGASAGKAYLIAGRDEPVGNFVRDHARDRLQRALRIEALSPGWRSSFDAMIESHAAGNAGLAPAAAST